MPAKSKPAAKKPAVNNKAPAKRPAESAKTAKPKKGASNAKSLAGGKSASKPAAKPAKPVKPAAKAAAPAPKKAAAKPAAKAASPAPAKKPAAKAAPAPAPAAKKASGKNDKPASAPAPAPTAKAAVVKVTPAKKEAAKVEPAPLRGAATGKTAGKASIAATVTPAPPPVKIPTPRRLNAVDEGITLDVPKKPVLPLAFLKKQRQRLIELRDAYLNSAEGVANDTLRAGSEGGESAFGMHQADAGSDAYDRDFALSLLAKEQDAIYEINEALKRIDLNTYGLCEMSGNLIPEERLEALPFTRFTVSCQERIEREQMGGRWNRPVRSLFGLDESAEDAEDEKDEDDTSSSSNESLDFSKE